MSTRHKGWTPRHEVDIFDQETGERRVFVLSERELMDLSYCAQRSKLAAVRSYFDFHTDREVLEEEQGCGFCQWEHDHLLVDPACPIHGPRIRELHPDYNPYRVAPLSLDPLSPITFPG